MRDFLITFRTNKRERKWWMEWLRDEWGQYADPKWDEQLQARSDHDRRLQDEGVGSGSFWHDQVMQYLSRAQVLGIETPLGKQAMLKSMATMTGLMESMIRVYGSLPAPGYPSGEIH